MRREALIAVQSYENKHLGHAIVTRRGMGGKKGVRGWVTRFARMDDDSTRPHKTLTRPEGCKKRRCKRIGRNEEAFGRVKQKKGRRRMCE